MKEGLATGNQFCLGFVDTARSKHAAIEFMQKIYVGWFGFCAARGGLTFGRPGFWERPFHKTGSDANSINGNRGSSGLLGLRNKPVKVINCSMSPSFLCKPDF